MRRSVRVVGALGALALIVIGAQPAVSQPPKQRTTISVFDPNVTPYSKEINEGSKKFGPGDWSVGLERFFDTDTCERSGRAITKFTFVKDLGKQDGMYIIDASVLFSDGKISIYSGGRFSEFENDGGAVFAVTGGTGAYQDATGTMTIEENTDLCDRKGATITFSLLLD
jgi:hypothetical protein